MEGPLIARRLFRESTIRVWLAIRRRKWICPLIRSVRYLACPLIREFTVNTLCNVFSIYQRWGMFKIRRRILFHFKHRTNFDPQRWNNVYPLNIFRVNNKSVRWVRWMYYKDTTAVWNDIIFVSLLLIMKPFFCFYN